MDATHALVSVKSKGNLPFPPKGVVVICLVCEKKFREKDLLYSDQPYAKLSRHDLHNIITLVLSEFKGRNIFFSLAQHMLDSEPVTNNLILLIKAVTETYLQVKYKLAARQFTARFVSLKEVNSRTRMNTMLLFSGM